MKMTMLQAVRTVSRGSPDPERYATIQTWTRAILRFLYACEYLRAIERVMR